MHASTLDKKFTFLYLPKHKFLKDFFLFTGFSKKELNASTYSIYLFLFRRFECTTLIIKELLLNLSHFIFTNIAIFIKP